MCGRPRPDPAELVLGHSTVQSQENMRVVGTVNWARGAEDEEVERREHESESGRENTGRPQTDRPQHGRTRDREVVEQPASTNTNIAEKVRPEGGSRNRNTEEDNDRTIRQVKHKSEQTSEW